MAWGERQRMIYGSQKKRIYTMQVRNWNTKKLENKFVPANSVQEAKRLLKDSLRGRGQNWEPKFIRFKKNYSYRGA